MPCLVLFLILLEKMMLSAQLTLFLSPPLLLLSDPTDLHHASNTPALGISLERRLGLGREREGSSTADFPGQRE